MPMMVRRENGHAVWFSSTLFSNIQSYPQSVDNSVENAVADRGKPMQKVRLVHGFSTNTAVSAIFRTYPI